MRKRALEIRTPKIGGPFLPERLDAFLDGLGGKDLRKQVRLEFRALRERSLVAVRIKERILETAVAGRAETRGLLASL